MGAEYVQYTYLDTLGNARNPEHTKEDASPEPASPVTSPARTPTLGTIPLRTPTLNLKGNRVLGNMLRVLKNNSCASRKGSV